MAAFALLATLAYGHSFVPGLLDLHERAGGIFDVVWRRPLMQGSTGSGDAPLMPDFGTTCRYAGEIVDPGAEKEEGRTVFRIDCGPTGLRERTIGVPDLPGHGADVLQRIRWADGTVTTSILRSGAEKVVVPGVATGAPVGSVLRRYGGFGVEHMLRGADHLAFVLGLLLLADGWWPLVETIMAFTLAHTITLGAAVIGAVHVSPAPVEAMLAVGIVLVAVEILRPPTSPPTLARRAPWLVAFLFGLLHGLSFAGALAAFGLPADHAPLALLAFNGGIEVGQLAFVIVVLPVVRGLRRGPRWFRRVPAYGIGAVAVAWTLERVAAFWP